MTCPFNFMVIKNILAGSIILLLTCFVYGQDRLIEFHSFYDDDFIEWDIYTEDEDGKLEMTWQQDRDKTEWSYDIGNYSGIIRKKWKGDSNLWELSNYEGYTIEFSPKWRNDLSEWQIKDGDRTIIFRSKYVGDYNEWTSLRSKYGDILIYTEYENDPRDWFIENTLDDEVSFEFSLVCAFICIHQAYSF